VAHFVRPGRALDEEGRARGNSVYLPRMVIPMLPEVLSNGVCSLQEGVPRFTKSAFVQFDDRGRVMGQRVASSVIRSGKRLTYLEAQALIDGDVHEARRHCRAEPRYDEALVEQLRLADRLARILRQRRLDDGMIVLDLPDVELVFDDEGHVVDAVPEDDAFTHTIIEMFMVEANEAVARTFSDLDVPVLRRVHPDPVHGDLEELRLYARAGHFRLPETPTRHDLQRLLDATRDTPAARAIHFAVLRTLTRASYSPSLIGHYALASSHYAHFTSPIRRYPDLQVHRALEAYLEATDNGRAVPGGRGRDRLSVRLREDSRVEDEGLLIELGRHCSETEQEAEDAERDLRDFLVMRFLHEHHLGDEFTGVITGVTARGVFISLERFLVEGFVRLHDVPRPGGAGDRWATSEHSGRLVAQRSGASLGLGDIVTVQIVGVDVASRTMDLGLTRLPAAGDAGTAAARPDESTDGPRRTRKGRRSRRR
jgi:ribonuclease R